MSATLVLGAKTTLMLSKTRADSGEFVRSPNTNFAEFCFHALG
jgi:hypothetical protein